MEAGREADGVLPERGESILGTAVGTIGGDSVVEAGCVAFSSSVSGLAFPVLSAFAGIR